MKRISLLVILLLVILVGCKEYGQPISDVYPTVGPGRPTYLGTAARSFDLHTDSLVVSDMAENQPTDIQISLPNIYAPNVHVANALKLDRGFDAELCKVYPDAEFPDGTKFCVSSTTPTGMIGITGMAVTGIEYVLSGLDYAPPNPNPGDTITLTATITNDGTALGTNWANVRIYWDGNLERSFTDDIGLIYIGTSATYTTTFTIPTGTSTGAHTLTLYVAPQNEVIDLSNNNETITVNVGAPPAAGKPELMILQPTFTPSSPTDQDTVVADIPVLNQGNADSIATTLNISVDGNTIAEINVPIVPMASGIVNVQYTFSPLTAGTHSIHFEIDPNNLNDEWVETNNQEAATLVVTAGAPPTLKPDLEPSFVNPPATTTAGTPTPITVRIENKGGAASIPTTFDLLVDGTPVATGLTLPRLFPALTAGMTHYQYTHTFTFAQGSHEVEIRVDDYPNPGIVDESNELNNMAKTTIIVGAAAPADLAVITLTVSPSVPAPASIATVTAEVKNIGGTKSTPSTIAAFYMDGQVIGAQVVPPLNPGAEITFTQATPLLTAGTHTANITVDPNHMVTDSDRSNNEKTATFSTSAAPTGKLIFTKGKILPPTVLASGFAIGTCKNPADPGYNPIIAQLLGNSYCQAMQDGDGIIKLFRTTAGWVIVLAGATDKDVGTAVDLFLKLGTLGPAQVYDEFEFRTTRLTLELFAKYYDGAGTRLYLLHYGLLGDPLTLMSFPIPLKNNQITDVFSPIMNDIERIYTYDELRPEMWSVYNPGPEPSDLTTVQPYQGYFLLMNDPSTKRLHLNDVEATNVRRNFRQGQVMFSPPRYSDLGRYANLIDLNEDIWCQTISGRLRGWGFTKATPTTGFSRATIPVDIGQVCWIESKGGAI